MRTLSHFTAALVAVTLLSSAASAQRNTRRSGAHRSVERPQASPRTVRGVSSDATGCANDCGDYALAVVSAVLPAESAEGSRDYVTVVIENRGTAMAPASIISIAPRNHLSLARHSSFGALAPGERTTVQLPVEIGADGTQCVSINITTAPIPAAPDARFLAAAPVAPPPGMPMRPSIAIPDITQWAGADDLGFKTPLWSQLDGMTHGMTPGLIDIGAMSIA